MTVDEIRSNLFSGLKSETKNLSSPFLDQGESHLFSDWLAASLWKTGVENPQEFYVGVFPDLSDFLTRENGRLAIDAETVKKLHSNANPDLLKVLRPAVEGRWFIDFCAGRPQRSVVPRLVAQLLGARAYIGVDLCYSGDSLKKNEFSALGNFNSYFLRNSWLDALEALKTQEPVFCLLSGVELAEPKSGDALAAKDRALKGFSQLKAKDFVMFGAGTTDFDWPNFPYKKIYSDHYHFLHRRKGAWPWSDWF